MKHLYLSECLRFKNAALIFAGVHLAIQLFLYRMTEMLQLRNDTTMVPLAVYLLAGLGFALYQVGSYRQPSRWVWLLHRPLPRVRIFGAIALAAFSLILFAVGLPVLLTVLGTEWFSERTVDVRHYLMVIELVLVTSITWLAGAYVMLNRSRSAIVILLLPFLLLAHRNAAFILLLPTLLCLALLGYVACASFKPDRLAPPATTGVLVATAAPLQLSFYFALIWIGSLIFQNLQIVAGTHPLNRSVPPAGGFTESTRSEGRDLFLRGLAVSTDARAAHWQRQIPLLEIGNFEAQGHHYPVRHEFINLDTLQWTDQARRIRWTFSHDAMRFHGSDLFTDQDRGWLGLRGMGDTQPFPAVPVLPPGHIMMPQLLLAIDDVDGALRPLLSLTAPETLTRTPKLFGRYMYVITNHRVIAFHAQAQGEHGMLKEAFSLPLPGPFSNFDRVDVAALVDGVLISMSEGRAMVDGAPDSAQTIVYVGTDGKVQPVVRRPLVHDFPALFEHHAWWVSPVLYTALALPDAMLDKGAILDRGESRLIHPVLLPRPPVAWFAAALATLLSACAAWVWLRKEAISRPLRIGWILACLVLGPPSFACLMVLQPRRRAAAARPPAPALAAATPG